MKYPKTLEEWTAQFNRLHEISQPLKPYQERLYQRAKVMIDTGGNPPPGEHDWLPDQTDLLCDIIANGGSFGDAARAIGKRVGAVQSRWTKIKRSLGWQAC